MNTLTPYQKRSLAFYLAHKDKKLTMTSMWIFNAKLYALLLIGSLAIAVILYLTVGGPVTAICVSLIVGTLARDVGTFRKSVMNWPLLNEIIDWKKAEELSADRKDS